MKTCSKCKAEKDESEFRKDKTRKDGLRSNCKSCHNILCCNYRINNPEKVKCADKKWRSENPERVKALKAKDYVKHSVKRKENSLKWYYENIEKSKSKRAMYYAENSEKEKARISKWKSENPEKVKEYKKLYYEKLPDSYIRNCISKGDLDVSAIPQPLVDFHREVIRAKRLLKELQK